MAYRINQDECTACGSCEPVCPVSCISEQDDGKRIINEEECTNCGLCADNCPAECIFEVV